MILRCRPIAAPGRVRLHVRGCAGFRTPGSREPPHDEVAGGRKAPRHEVAGSWAPTGQRVLWRFNVGADLDDGRDASTTAPASPAAGGVRRVQWAFRRAL